MVRIINTASSWLLCACSLCLCVWYFDSHFQPQARLINTFNLRQLWPANFQHNRIRCKANAFYNVVFSICFLKFTGKILTQLNKSQTHLTILQLVRQFVLQVGGQLMQLSASCQCQRLLYTVRQRRSLQRESSSFQDWRMQFAHLAKNMRFLCQSHKIGGPTCSAN